MTAPQAADTASQESGQPNGRQRLELVDLHKHYGSVAALDGLSLSVAAGRICGFVGANGAGKTTAMRATMGVLEPDSGAVRWGSHPVDAAARRRFGYMPEERGLYPKMRAGDQLAYFARLHGMGKARAAEAAQHWTSVLGIAERLDDRVDKLSLGNQQRVQLAAALVHGPDLLVLDEPFSGLDPVGVDALAEVLLERARAGAAVLFSSHQLELVERLCDEVAIVGRGSIVASGTVEQLRTGDRRLLRVQVDSDTAANAGWTHGVPGVELVDVGADGALLELADGADEQAVLDAARAAGRVVHFGFEQRSLAKTFREVVAQ